jgi:NADH-quinone oxidoreductase subunit C
MSDEVKGLADQLKAQFPGAVGEIDEFRGDVTVTVERKAIADVCTTCRDSEGFEFNLLSDLCGIDYYPNTPRFAVSYVLYSLSCNHTIRLKVFAPEEDPVVPTVTGVWPGSNWPEREAYDMFGITFEGHPDLRRVLMPFDWTGHPLRKDYPLGYEEVQFTFNAGRVQANKPSPKD